MKKNEQSEKLKMKKINKNKNNIQTNSSIK